MQYYYLFIGSIQNVIKTMRKYPNLDLVHIISYKKFGKIYQFVLKVLSRN